MRKGMLFAAILGLGCAVSPVVAHHSFSMFDQTKLLPLSGTVSKFTWTNPHSFVVVESRDTKYVLECNSVNLMKMAGWKINTLKPGDKVTLDYYPLRNGTAGGMLKTITLPNGTKLKAW